MIRQRLESIASVDKVAPQVAAADKSSARPPSVPSDGKVRFSLRDGQRFSGTLSRVEDAYLTLTAPSTREPLSVPLVDLRSLIMPRPESAANAGSPVAGREIGNGWAQRQGLSPCRKRGSPDPATSYSLPGARSQFQRA